VTDTPDPSFDAAWLGVLLALSRVTCGCEVTMVEVLLSDGTSTMAPIHAEGCDFR
jgi:hypothetical protein